MIKGITKEILSIPKDLFSDILRNETKKLDSSVSWKLFDKCSTSAQTVIHAHYVTVKGAMFFPKANIYGLQRIYSNRPYISGLMIIF